MKKPRSVLRGFPLMRKAKASPGEADAAAAHHVAAGGRDAEIDADGSAVVRVAGGDGRLAAIAALRLEKLEV
jgi:hypothetical protein